MQGTGLAALPFLKEGFGAPTFPLHLWQVLLALLLVCAALVAVSALLLAAQARHITSSSHDSDQGDLRAAPASDHPLIAEVAAIARRQR